MYADDSNSLYSLITISGKKKKKMFKTFDTHIANMSFNEKSLLHLFCIYSLNNDFITHSECFHIFNFKNNKIKKKPNNKQKNKTNKQILHSTRNGPFSKQTLRGALHIRVDRNKFALIFSFVFSEKM